MRRILPALLLSVLFPVLGGAPAHADVLPECVYATVGGGGAIGYSPTVTVCRP